MKNNKLKKYIKIKNQSRVFRLDNLFYVKKKLLLDEFVASLPHVMDVGNARVIPSTVYPAV